MPIYDYECEKCSQGFEHEHAMSFTGKVKCPACGSSRTVKVFHAAGVHFKGSGFYVTDSSNSRSAITTPPATNGSETGSEIGSDNGSDKGSDNGVADTVEKTPAKKATAQSGSGKGKKTATNKSKN